MKRKSALVSLVFLVMFMMLTTVEAVPRLEFIDVPDSVKLEESFTFSVKLTDARYYDYFSLYGETPSGEEMYFGEHIFEEGLWFQYTNEWTLNFSSFNETGYHTLSVDAGDLSWIDTVDKITASCSIYVVRTVTTVFPPPPWDVMILARLFGLFVVIGGVFLMLGYAAWRKRKEVVEAVPTSRW